MPAYRWLLGHECFVVCCLLFTRLTALCVRVQRTFAQDPSKANRIMGPQTGRKRRLSGN
jgi:hypothetical protein